MSKEETKKYFDLERKKHFDFFIPYYKEKHWLMSKDNIDGNTPISWDVRLEVFASKFKLVDEKVRKGDYGDCLIELIQDLKTGKLGWFFGEKDWVLYGSWTDTSATRPSSLYLIRMIQLREYIYSLNGILQTAISHKGWGITWNIILKWDILKDENIVEKLI